MSKSGLGNKPRRVKPLERVLQFILLLGLLFIVYQALVFLLTREKEPIPQQNTTQIVGTLISTINYLVPELPTNSFLPSPTWMISTPTPGGTSTTTAILTPVVQYLLAAKNYIPDVASLLGNYSLDSEQAMDISPMRGNAYQVLFTNSYPLYHESDDPYAVSYFIYVFSETESADDFYGSLTMESIISIYQATYNQRIYPTPIDRVVENIDALKMFCFNFTGTTKPEIHCQSMLRADNLVGQVVIKLFNLGSSATKSIAQTSYFTDLLVKNLK